VLYYGKRRCKKMSKKVYNLVVAIVGGLSTIAIGFVTFFNPTFATAINASIGIGATAIVEICGNFVEK
jgi:uncharacterized membrane protein HdeD (DUF308 family)